MPGLDPKRLIDLLRITQNESWPTRYVATNSITALKSLVMRAVAESMRRAEGWAGR